MNLIPILVIAMATVAGALIYGHRGAAIGFLAAGLLVLAANVPPNRPRYP